MSTDRYAILEVSREMLKDLLHLPESWTIVHVENALDYRWSIFLYIVDESFPLVTVGSRGPFLEVMFKNNYDSDCGHIISTELQSYKIK